MEEMNLKDAVPTSVSRENDFQSLGGAHLPLLISESEAILGPSDFDSKVTKAFHNDLKFLGENPELAILVRLRKAEMKPHMVGLSRFRASLGG